MSSPLDAALKAAVHDAVCAEILPILRHLARPAVPETLDDADIRSMLRISQRKLVDAGAPHLLVGDVRRWEPERILAWARERAVNGR
jgi:hypothetical protein